MKQCLKKIRMAALWNIALFSLLSITIITSLNLSYNGFNNLFFNLGKATSISEIITYKNNQQPFIELIINDISDLLITNNNSYYLIANLNDGAILIETTQKKYSLLTTNNHSQSIVGHVKQISDHLNNLIETDLLTTDLKLTTLLIEMVELRFIYLAALTLIATFLFIIFKNMIIVINPKKTNNLKNIANLDSIIEKIDSQLDQTSINDNDDGLIIVNDYIILQNDINIVLAKIDDLKRIHCFKRKFTDLLPIKDFSLVFIFNDFKFKINTSSQEKVFAYINTLHIKNNSIIITG